MSVLSNSTHFNITNNTSKFMVLSLSADQSSSFRITHNSSNIVETPRRNIEHASYASWLVDNVANWTKGSSMQMVTINLPSKETIQCDISCSGALEFSTSVRDTKVSEPTDGNMIIPPENQGCELHIIYTEEKGLGYTKKGDVAIGLGDICSRTMYVHSQVKTMDGHTVEMYDNIPAMCKIVV